MKPIDHCLSLLAALVVSEPGQERAVDEPLEALTEALDAYLRLGTEDKAKIRATLSDYEARSIMTLSGEAAERALNDREPNLLRYALLAHDIEGFRNDPRDNILHLSLIHHVARRIGKDPKAVFESVLSDVSQTTAEHLAAFVRRPESSKKLMALREVSTPDGIRFEPTD